MATYSYSNRGVFHDCESVSQTYWLLAWLQSLCDRRSLLVRLGNICFVKKSFSKKDCVKKVSVTSPKVPLSPLGRELGRLIPRFLCIPAKNMSFTKEHTVKFRK